MTDLRWRYALRDLWLNKSRTILVILSIAVGIFAFGIIAGAAGTLNRELPISYMAIHPASATLHTSPLSDEDIDAIARMPAVAAAEGRNRAIVRFQLPSGEWHDLQLIALDDYQSHEVDIVRPYQGAWPPSKHEILIERNSLGLTEAEIGETLLIEAPGSQARSLRIGGLAHDMKQPPAQITGVPYGYVERDTLEWLGLDRAFNEVHLLVENRPFDKQHITQVAHEAADKLEGNGRIVYWQEVPNPGEHFVMDFLPTILLILIVLGVLALILSGFLVINVITAILTQQTRQIGVMKTVGAEPRQIALLYMRMVAIFGVAALLVSIPLGFLGASIFSRFIAAQLNFDIERFRLGPGVLALELLIGVLVPVVAGLFPIRRAAQLTVREAVQERGLADVSGENNGRLARAQAKLPISRPVRLSLRNTFRRRSRLVRTLIPLMMGGAIFMTVLSVRASLFHTLEETLVSQGFDVQLQLDRPYRREQIVPSLSSVSDVGYLESWTLQEGVPIRVDGSDADSIVIYALPPATRLLQPDMVDGRWLTESDTNAIVVPTGLLLEEPDIALGSTLPIRIGNKETDWEVVGVHQVFQPPIAPAIVYMSQDHFWREYGQFDRVNVIRMLADEHGAATLAAIAAESEALLDARSVEVTSTRTATEDRDIFSERFNIITVILMVMAFLLATVGSLGLIGTMSINVLERRREIGVLRAIGASTRNVLRIFVIEGVIIGMISWVGALILSQPLSRILSRVVGMTFAKLPLSYVYDLRAPILWLLLVIIVSALASLWPARNAANLTVRETLAYE